MLVGQWLESSVFLSSRLVLYMYILWSIIFNILSSSSFHLVSCTYALANVAACLQIPLLKKRSKPVAAAVACKLGVECLWILIEIAWHATCRLKITRVLAVCFWSWEKADMSFWFSWLLEKIRVGTGCCMSLCSKHKKENDTIDSYIYRYWFLFISITSCCWSEREEGKKWIY